MSAPSKAALQATINRLERQIAETEATLGTLRSKLAKAQARATGAPPPETGLDLLWKTALPISRTRSSRHKCRVAWNRIPPHERPTVREMVEALTAWNRCPEWRKDGNAYAIALDRWIAERRWQDLPELPTSSPPRPSPPKPVPAPPPDPAELITDRSEIAALLRPALRQVQS